MRKLLTRTTMAESPHSSSIRPPSPKFLLDAKRLAAHNLGGFLSLSDKERGVMQLLARGFTAREAAEVLKLSPSTVDNHRTRIMRKLQISHMTQITRKALRAGLID